MIGSNKIEFEIRDYDLAATLNCGQAFRWRARDAGWDGVIGKRWVHLRPTTIGIEAQTVGRLADWRTVHHYLQLEADLSKILGSFPPDSVLLRSVQACRGLRLLRQEPWECLASFILSANKQIVQIQQIIAAVCQRWGTSLEVPAGALPAWTFPTPEAVAAASEEQLRACKMGFRAPNLLSTARWVAEGRVDLNSLYRLDIDHAREILVQLPGVGQKIADCVLLFGYGFQKAFPVDVWIMKALHQLYFPRRRPRPARLRQFIEEHFGPHAGYAQQYLFHYMRHHRATADSTGGPS